MLKMNIAEEDIFNYVFFNKKLDKSKKQFIDENKELFAGEIEFCSPAGIAAEEMDSLMERAGEKFGQIPAARIIVLYPEVQKIPSHERITFAAASPELNKETRITTFSDEGANFIVRLVQTREKELMYIFPREESSLEELKITLKPSMVEYNIAKVSSKIEISDASVVSSISVESIG